MLTWKTEKKKEIKMPFQSKAQMRYLYSQHPDIAKRWARETTNIKNLPMHKLGKVKKKKK